MPRNSRDNSLERFAKTKELIKPYMSGPRFTLSRHKSPYALNKLKQKNKVRKAFKQLHEPYKTIFKNTFFKDKDFYWWSNCYSKTTFYRLRNKAISSFLDAYQNL